MRILAAQGMKSPVHHNASSDSDLAVASPSQVEAHDAVMVDSEIPKNHSESADKAPTQPRRVKKPTYRVRKEEKELLLQELDILQTQLKQLKRQAAVSAAKSEQERPSVQGELSKEFLAGASQLQQLSLVNIQSALSSYVVRIRG